MYKTFFQLSENPFNNTPDPRYLYLSPSHKEALDHLLYGIEERKGFIAVTGGIGMGKTTLCRALLGRLDRSTRTSLVFNSFVSGMELLETINQEFGILPRPRDREDGKKDRLRAQGRRSHPSTNHEPLLGRGSKKRYIDSLNGFLLDTFRRGGNAVLIIDEAQNLPPDALEQIRMLSNLETEREKLLQIILIGQSELREVLEGPSLRQLNQRITVRYELRPLSVHETRGYILHRLSVAGGNGSLKFTSSAFDRIHHHSNGVPRRVNSICDRALLIAYTSETHIVSGNMIDRAEEEIQGGLAVSRGGKRGSGPRAVLTTVLIILLVAVSAFAGWRYKDSISRLLDDQLRNRAAKVTLAIEREPPVRADDQGGLEGLSMDDKSSMEGLLDLYRSSISGSGPASSLAVFSFQLGPEYHVMMKRPFRVLMSRDSTDAEGTRRYLLIRKTAEEGVFAKGHGKEERFLPRSLVLGRWGGVVTLIFAHDPYTPHLRRGMQGPEVLDLQRGLHRLGYIVPTTGQYGPETIDQVSKFQRDFGLAQDGVAGLKTRALLYGMTEQ